MSISNNKLGVFIIYTLVIGGSFYLGIFFYVNYTLTGNAQISYVKVKEFRPIIEKVLEKDFYLKISDKTETIKSSELKNFAEEYFRHYSGKHDLRVSYEKIHKYLESIAPRYSSEPVNAKLIFKNNKAEVFIPHTNGKKIDTHYSALLIHKALNNGLSSVSLELEVLEPEVALSKINNLGIEALLGRGESDYGKSSSSRIHNIKIGMSKFNGILLRPGEEFSFNRIIGEIEEKQGFKSEFVIKNGKLEKEFGGGLCQVATTIFRSAIMSGLEIKERKPHSFPVQYYNPQGFDATVYPGVVDLRFINNTDKHVLIQTKLKGSRLSAEIYGSKPDDKKVVLEGPVQHNQKPSGAMKAYFIRKIYKGENLAEEKRFDSVYKAPPPSPLERNPLE